MFVFYVISSLTFIIPISKDTPLGSISGSHDIKAGTGDAMRDDRRKRKKRMTLSAAARKGEGRRRPGQSESGSGSSSQSGRNQGRNGSESSSSTSESGGSRLSRSIKQFSGFHLASMTARSSRANVHYRARRQADEWENVGQGSSTMPPQQNIEKIKNTFMQFFDACMDIVKKVANTFRSGNNPQNGSGNPQTESGYPQNE